jgi:hypothetical protein
MKTPIKRSVPTKERRHGARLSLAIPVFVRGINGRGTEFLEFSTLLNECRWSPPRNAQALAALVAGIARDTFFTDSKKCDVARSGAHAAGTCDSHYVWGRLQSMWLAICPSACLVTQNEVRR